VLIYIYKLLWLGAGSLTDNLYITYIDGRNWYYIPYLIELVKVKKNTWEVRFNGGNFDIQLDRASSILFLGVNDRTGSLPLQFIEECGQNKVQIVINRTHHTEPRLLSSLQKHDRDNVLTAQILARENDRKSAYIARVLIRKCFKGRDLLVATSDNVIKQTSKNESSKQLMLKGAEFSRFFWQRYFKKLDLTIARRDEHPINRALDACSHYFAGILLKWVHTYGLSPAHGFLHSATHYESLVYDLIEPYRYIFEQVVATEWLKYSNQHRPDPVNDEFTEQCLAALKAHLDEPIKTEPTRQKIYRKGLLRGSVTALKHYLLGNMRHFVPPSEVEKYKGAQVKVSYNLPSQIWSAK
jgi:CRISPR/Cas system-associated endonuclease Cas1